MPLAALVSGVLGLYRDLDKRAAAWAEYCHYDTGQLSQPMPLDSLPSQPPNAVRVVCISDTHLAHSKYVLPKGDILLHAGDISWLGKYTGRHSREHFAHFTCWLKGQGFPHVVFIAGNHDLCCEEMGREAVHAMVETPTSSIHYLEDQELSLEVRGAPVRLFGSPRCVKPNPEAAAAAFTLRTEAELAAHWRDTVPDTLHIFVSHQPVVENERGQVAKFDQLASALQAKQPRLHVCGHSHHAHGAYQLGPTLSINAALMGKAYRPQYFPIVVDLPLHPDGDRTDH